MAARTAPIAHHQIRVCVSIQVFYAHPDAAVILDVPGQEVRRDDRACDQQILATQDEHTRPAAVDQVHVTAAYNPNSSACALNKYDQMDGGSQAVDQNAG